MLYAVAKCHNQLFHNQRVENENVINQIVGISVVHFDQQTGAPHAICWLKSFFGVITGFPIFFLSFSVINGKKLKKTCHKRESTSV